MAPKIIEVDMDGPSEQTADPTLQGSAFGSSSSTAIDSVPQELIHQSEPGFHSDHRRPPGSFDLEERNHGGIPGIVDTVGLSAQGEIINLANDEPACHEPNPEVTVLSDTSSEGGLFVDHAPEVVEVKSESDAELDRQIRRILGLPEDDDDECKIVDPSDVPEDTKAKFAGSKFGSVPERNVEIKRELDNGGESSSQPNNHFQNDHGQQEGVGQREDDEDDFMIIEPSEIPVATKAKFDEFKFGEHPDAAGDVLFMGAAPIIKTEEDLEDEILAITSDSSSDNEAHSEFEPDEDDVPSDEGRPKKRRRPASKGSKGSKGKSPRKKPNQRRERRKPSKKVWQMPTDEELEQIYKQREDLRALNAEGLLNDQQKLELARVSARISTIEKRVVQQSSGGPPQGPQPPSADPHTTSSASASSRPVETITAGQPEISTAPEPANNDDAEEGEDVDVDLGVHQQLAVIQGRLGVGEGGEP
jgi:hypothetical protein